MIAIKCDGCGSVIIPGNRPDGTPNGLGMETMDGKIITVCADCIIKVGKDKRYLDKILKNKN